MLQWCNRPKARNERLAPQAQVMRVATWSAVATAAAVVAACGGSGGGSCASRSRTRG